MSSPTSAAAAAEAYRHAACSVPLVGGARFSDAAGEGAVHVRLVQRDLDGGRAVQLEDVRVPPSYEPATPAPVLAAPSLAESWSPSRRLRAVVERDPGTGSGKDTPKDAFLVKVFCGARLVACVPTRGLHGELHAGGMLGDQGVAWSPDETALAYVAERKDPERPSFWEPPHAAEKAAAAREKGGTDAPLQPGRAHEHADHMGEEMTAAVRPALFVLRVRERRVTEVRGVPAGLTVGQPCFAPDSRGLLFVGWPSEPRVLGLRHYNTRRSRIYLAPDAWAGADDDGDGNAAAEAARPLTGRVEGGPDHSAMCPRLSPDGASLAYVSTDPVPWHSSCSRLIVADWARLAAGDADAARTVVDVVQDAGDCTDDSVFPGLWPATGGIGMIPPRPWLGDSRRLALSTSWRSREAVVVVDTRLEGAAAVRRLDAPAEGPLASLALLDAAGDALLVRASALNRPPAVYRTGLDGGSGWRLVSDPTAEALAAANATGAGLDDGFREALARVTGARVRVLRVESSRPLPARAPDGGGPGPAAFEAILLEPAREQGAPPPPLVVFPHGGPHSADSTHYWGGVAFLASLGQAVLLINYRGSRGFGQRSLASLPGRCGEQDVRDVLDAAEAAKALDGGSAVDASRVRVTGGSHGGYLTLMLIGQHPDAFEAAAARNPVANIAHMAASTDIPDWCYSECGEPYSAEALPTEEQYARMFRMSPVRYVGGVRTPLLLMIGDADLRVPPAQGMDYFRLLRGRGERCPPSRLLVYKGNNHGLRATLGAEADGWVNLGRWLCGSWKDQ